ncbi:purine-binding chemotaxis protein CheW [Jatrophihabitans endophyticus]|uniref:Purine-binding chemotaxis protein CheW n=1 Tax=Jatrophihabitans endophyticus TaxID=1206085 RepID=A0A1M5IHT8_9ACTN|nr:chemotaxis protein CheW [Jatrophihabitans endophyticus]SHG27821.1 purine-binding chemotaxis protein CheW [Jatrophihabitans endophyticus]
MTHQLATFTLCNDLYGVPVDRVQEVLQDQRSTGVPLAPGAVSGLMNLRGEVVLVLDLRRRLALADRTAEETPTSVVIRIDGEVISLLVDRIGDVVDVDPAIFESPPETLGGVARELIEGAYKLDDRLLLALDVDRAVTVAA